MSTPTPMGTAVQGRGRKSAERLLLEETLQHASRPLTMDELISHTGVHAPAVRRLVWKMLYLNVIHRAPGTVHAFVLGPQPAPHQAAEAPPAPAASADLVPVRLHVAATTRGSYDGRELAPFGGRPRAMDAFTLPSLRNGTRHTHRPPMCMGGRANDKRSS